MGFLGKIKRNTERLIYVTSVNNRIKKAKYVHLMFNDKFNKPFVDFLNKNFNPKEHLFLCKKMYEEFPFPIGDNVIELKYLSKLKFDKAQKLLCHSLFDNEVIEYLYNHPDTLKEKAYWIIWGGDLYDAVRDEKNDFVRKNFKGYISSVCDDAKIAKEKYNSEAKIYYAPYWGLPVNAQMLENAKTIRKPDYIQIQINNSSDESTLEMLDILSEFANENIKITTPLSYGDMQYKDEIIKKGKEIFGEKFEYLDKYMNSEDYAKYMALNHVLVLNQNRQQGGGSAYCAAHLGSKVYIKSDVSTYINMQNSGINVFDTYRIKDMNFAEFIKYEDDVKKQNMKAAQDYHKGIFALQQWRKVFSESGEND